MAASYNESLAASWELPPATFVILSCHQHCLHSTRLSFLPPHPPPSLPPLYSSYQRNFLTLRVPAAAYLPLPSQPYHLRSYLHTLPTFKYLYQPSPTPMSLSVDVIQQHFLPTCCQFWTVGPGLVGGFQSKVSFSVHFLHHSMLARRFTLCVRLSQSAERRVTLCETVRVWRAACARRK